MGFNIFIISLLKSSCIVQTHITHPLQTIFLHPHNSGRESYRAFHPLFVQKVEFFKICGMI